MSLVIRTVEDHVATVMLNRPESLDALNRSMRRESTGALADIRMDGDVRAVILTGAGRAFSVGQDLGELEQDAGEEDPTNGHRSSSRFVPCRNRWSRR